MGKVALGSGDEGRAIGVIRTLVVVLEVPPVDTVTNCLGNGVVCAMRVEVGIIGEPWSDRSVGDDELCREK
jgi:hypothetical protein